MRKLHVWKHDAAPFGEENPVSDGGLVPALRSAERRHLPDLLELPGPVRFRNGSFRPGANPAGKTLWSSTGCSPAPTASRTCRSSGPADHPSKISLQVGSTDSTNHGLALSRACLQVQSKDVGRAATTRFTASMNRALSDAKAARTALWLTGSASCIPGPTTSAIATS